MRCITTRHFRAKREARKRRLRATNALWSDTSRGPTIHSGQCIDALSPRSRPVHTRLCIHTRQRRLLPATALRVPAHAMQAPETLPLTAFFNATQRSGQVQRILDVQSATMVTSVVEVSPSTQATMPVFGAM